MAEINTAADSGGRRKSFAHGKKHSTRVDLTPMVDLGFLLITFFIITTSLAEKKVLKLNMPADGPPITTGESGTITLLPGSNDSLYYFMGELNTAISNRSSGWQSYSVATGVGDLIRQKQRELASTGRKNDLMVIISPTPNSSYKNLVDLLDEMLINEVKKYVVSGDQQALETLRLNGLVPPGF